MCDGPMEIAEKYIKIKNLVHAWLDFVTKLHKYTSFAYNSSISKECKKWDTVVLDGDKMCEN